MNKPFAREIAIRSGITIPIRRDNTREWIAMSLSVALAFVAVITSAASFFAWGIFSRDVPMSVGNMRGTALTMLVVAVPALFVSMFYASAGSLRGKFVWLGALAYLCYNAVLFCFSVHFNSLFLLYTSLLCLAFWGTLTRFAAFNLAEVAAATKEVTSRTIAAYLLLSGAAFCALWLKAIVPATLNNSVPDSLTQSGLIQNPVWVLDFAFTFPLMALGAIWIWKHSPWGYIIAAMMVIMLTIETISIGVDQVFGHLHDASAPTGAVPAMIVFSIAGLFFSILFLSRVRQV